MKIYVVVKSRLTAPASSTCIPLERLLKMPAANWADEDWELQEYEVDAD